MTTTPDTSPERTTYLSCADTAKLLRQALKAAHPGQKFSVRSSTYAGGASIDVSWTDGPTASQVEQTTRLYNGATFDGMIDLKSYHSSILVDPDGTPREVHFGADFIFTSRSVTDELLDYLAEHATQNGGYLAHVSHPEQCAICGNWIPAGDCWIAGPDQHRRMVCNSRCAARLDVRYYDASPAGGYTA